MIQSNLTMATKILVREENIGIKCVTVVNTAKFSKYTEFGHKSPCIEINCYCRVYIEHGIQV